ncbi:antitoxin Xre/MbcA/ParS toxin-binding domain-containing protein [Niveibacterium sp. COAC-50]|uniref:antitoxin Xre/MbcA/ParS toxin-binding domain-containing protein n=1 Tax=Niveibacterium sp. COAC-50 TaxID=2729384 RepID=UPI00352FF064
MRAAVTAGTVAPRLKMKSKTWDLALHLASAYRALHALVGGNDCEARLWFHGAAPSLSGQRPRDAVGSIEGLISVER